jgi:hypothetical protein
MQLDRYVESGEIWGKVHSLMDSGIGSDGMLLSGSRLEEILKKSEEFQSLSPRGQ